ncbi:MAG: hypothetical protein NTY55_09985 [Flavobacteriia bacterium]|jgi:hypothetical protein|nr:hypothetical protein [Flavobacteriia bacterium]
MQQIFKSLFPELPDSSRIWLHLANRKLVASEEQFLKEQLTVFLDSWSAHGKRLQCNATLLFSQYLIFSVDENIESASGCSIDSSVHFAKRMGSELGIDFFTRLEVLVVEGNETRLLSYFDAVAQKAPFINPQITQLYELRSMQC